MPLATSVTPAACHRPPSEQQSWSNSGKKVVNIGQIRRGLPAQGKEVSIDHIVAKEWSNSGQIVVKYGSISGQAAVNSPSDLHDPLVKQSRGIYLSQTVTK